MDPGISNIARGDDMNWKICVRLCFLSSFSRLSVFLNFVFFLMADNLNLFIHISKSIRFENTRPMENSFFNFLLYFLFFCYFLVDFIIRILTFLTIWKFHFCKIPPSRFKSNYFLKGVENKNLQYFYFLNLFLTLLKNSI